MRSYGPVQVSLVLSDPDDLARYEAFERSAEGEGKTDFIRNAIDAYLGRKPIPQTQVEKMFAELLAKISDGRATVQPAEEKASLLEQAKRFGL